MVPLRLVELHDSWKRIKLPDSTSDFAAAGSKLRNPAIHILNPGTCKHRHGDRIDGGLQSDSRVLSVLSASCQQSGPQVRVMAMLVSELGSFEVSSYLGPGKQWPVVDIY